MTTDSNGTIYFTDYENNAIHARTSNGQLLNIAYNDAILWPDAFTISEDGFLYFTTIQFQRMPMFHYGVDLRERPFVIFRIKINAGPSYPFLNHCHFCRKKI